MENKKTEHYQTADVDRVPVRQKLLYSQGSILAVIGDHVVMEMAGIILNVNLFVRPSLVGLAGTISRLWGACLDPLIGNWSDNSRFKLGRRRPFILIGAILCSLTFPLIWLFKRGWSEVGIFSWFLFGSLLFYTAHTVFSVPFHTLALELSPDYHEKTRIAAWREFFAKSLFVLVGWLFFFTEQFRDPVGGMRWVSLGLAVLFVVSGVLPGLFVKERFYKAARHQRKMPIRASLKATLSSGSFRLTLGMVALTILGGWTGNYFGRYVNIYYVFDGDTHAASIIAGWRFTVEMAAAVGSIPLFTWLSRRYGKLAALKVNAWFVVVSSLTRLVMVNPAHPWLLVANAALTGPGGTGFWIILTSLLADICDEDELKTGCRREGSYTSVGALTVRGGLAIAYLIANVLLELTGFNAEFGGEQQGHSLLLMRSIFTFLPAVSMIGIFWLISRYRLDEARCLEIRRELETRRGML